MSLWAAMSKNSPEVCHLIKSRLLDSPPDSLGWRMGVAQWAHGIIFTDLCRSGLFQVSEDKKGRDFRIDESIPCQSGYKVKYTGYRLSQYDLDVLTVIISLLLPYRTGEVVKVNFTKLESLLGKKGGAGRERIRQSLKRINKSHIEIAYYESDLKEPVREFSGHIIESVEIEYKSWVLIQASSGMERLFVSVMPMHVRYKLSRDLSKWLLMYWSTHREIYPIKIDNVCRLCGSRTQRLAHFKELLKKACNELIDAGYLAGFQFENDVLHAQRARGGGSDARQVVAV
ncbi:TrfA family protein [Desulfurispirillum indicum S5]|uniref:TrfA family protein n=1 Tax=Desulfurispirillum indicum (strain ATCC BAA-1389 / DSM 22839 / S5) TaxID=653733 RepID=E6W6B3_DESIS|nr:plasmid replication initiator TrfA [Desulfurispirillum indicum]ADU66149.1 TrfA family protein [Desulfurispirillum indicum S5]